VLPRKAAGSRLHGSQLFDMLALLVLLAAASTVRLVRPGLIYYWMKDITWEFLKIPVLFSALEIFDKVCSGGGCVGGVFVVGGVEGGVGCAPGQPAAVCRRCVVSCLHC
jgi:hypothetical protein